MPLRFTRLITTSVPVTSLNFLLARQVDIIYARGMLFDYERTEQLTLASIHFPTSEGCCGMPFQTMPEAILTLKLSKTFYILGLAHSVSALSVDNHQKTLLHFSYFIFNIYFTNLQLYIYSHILSWTIEAQFLNPSLLCCFSFQFF